MVGRERAPTTACGEIPNDREAHSGWNASRTLPGHPFLYALDAPVLQGIKIGFSTQCLHDFRARYTTAYGQRFTIHYVGNRDTCLADEAELKQRLQPFLLSGELFDARCLPVVLSHWAFRYGAANIRVTSAALISTLSSMSVSRSAAALMSNVLLLDVSHKRWLQKHETHEKKRSEPFLRGQEHETAERQQGLPCAKVDVQQSDESATVHVRKRSDFMRSSSACGQCVE